MWIKYLIVGQNGLNEMRLWVKEFTPSLLFLIANFRMLCTAGEAPLKRKIEFGSLGKPSLFSINWAMSSRTNWYPCGSLGASTNIWDSHSVSELR